MTFKEDYEKTCKDVFTELEKTMASIDTEALEQLTEDILNADQVFFVGVGRVMLALQCVCKRLESKLIMLGRSQNQLSQRRIF